MSKFDIFREKNYKDINPASSPSRERKQRYFFVMEKICKTTNLFWNQFNHYYQYGSNGI